MLVDVLNYSNGLVCGVVMVKVSIIDEELDVLYVVGVWGVCFNFVKWLVDVLLFDDLMFIVECIKCLGWYIVIYFEVVELFDLYDFFISLLMIVVVDYMGCLDVIKLVDGEEFGLFFKLLEENLNFWFKVSCFECLLISGFDGGYLDVVLFVWIVVECFLECVLWGIDWFYLNMKSYMLDDGKLVDMIFLIVLIEVL